MPRSERTVAYGPEYEQLTLLSFAAEGEISFPFPSPSIARSMKSKVYCYWKALRKEGLRPDLIEKSDLLSMRTEANLLVFFRRDDAWDVRLLRDSMGLEKGFAVTLPGGTLVAKSPTDELRERRYRMREEKQQR